MLLAPTSMCVLPALLLGLYSSLPGPLGAAASCSPRTPPQNACYLERSLEVFSEPAGLPVNADNCDVVYEKEEFKLPPKLSYLLAEPEQSYTLLMLDPDAPNRTSGQYYLHWIRANIPGKDLRRGDLRHSTELTSYLGPAPPLGSGLHRYMFLLYRQTHCLTTPVGDPERQFFTVSVWLARVARLGVRLCGPIAAVQFRAGYGQTHQTQGRNSANTPPRKHECCKRVVLKD